MLDVLWLIRTISLRHHSTLEIWLFQAIFLLLGYFFKNTYSDFIWNCNQEKLDLVKISNTKLAILFASNGGTAFPT